MTVYRDICEYSYRDLVKRCSDTENAMDLVALSAWLEDQIAMRVRDYSTDGEAVKKAAFLALLFIEFAAEPGRGMVQ